jgi:hypothetical protein
MKTIAIVHLEARPLGPVVGQRERHVGPEHQQLVHAPQQPVLLGAGGGRVLLEQEVEEAGLGEGAL